jgi:hypothetical protein
LHRVEQFAQAAVQAVADVLEGEAKDADKLRAAQLLLDRIGVGPHSSSDVNVSSDLERWIAELDEEEARKATVVALPEVQPDDNAD